MNLRMVTLTGADDSIAPVDLLALSAKYPFVEWGILVSKKNMGGPRYPSPAWLQELKEIWPAWGWMPKRGMRLGLSSFRPSLSLHVCGKWVRDICSGHIDPEMMDLPLSWGAIDRVQLNFHGEAHEKAKVSEAVRADILSGKQIILQNDGSNSSLGFEFVPLFDKSGGAGILPKEWPLASSAGEHEMYGYAGGLGPSNLDEQLREIAKASEGRPFWVDMETNVRSSPWLNDKRFDLEACERCLQICERFVVSE